MRGIHWLASGLLLGIKKKKSYMASQETNAYRCQLSPHRVLENGPNAVKNE
jgi:hypothetical protein